MKISVIIFYGKLVFEYKSPIVPNIGDTVIIGGSQFRVIDRIFDYSENKEITIKVIVDG